MKIKAREDFLADVDAIVIFKTIDNMQMLSLEDYFIYHYTYNYQIRYSLIESCISYEESLETVDEYLQYTEVLNYILTKTSQKNLSKSQRNAIRDAFVDYFWECVENE